MWSRYDTTLYANDLLLHNATSMPACSGILVVVMSIGSSDVLYVRS